MSEDEKSFGWTSTDDQESDDENNANDSSRNILPENIKRERIDSPLSGSVDSSEDEPNRVVDSSLRGSNRSKLNGSISRSKVFEPDKKLIDAYLETHPNLKSLRVSQNNCITDNDDLWLLQCLPIFDLSSLSNINILDGDKHKIKIPNSKYECVNVEKETNEEIFLILPPNKEMPCTIDNFKLKGKFVIREKLKNVAKAQREEEEDRIVPFPADLKIRHPLFGRNYKKCIKLPADVCEKLANPPLRKLKSNESEVNNEHCMEHDEPDNITVKQSKRKRKASTGAEDDLVKKKKAKIQQGMWESEKSIEMNLFDLPVKKKNKVK